MPILLPHNLMNVLTLSLAMPAAPLSSATKGLCTTTTRTTTVTLFNCQELSMKTLLCFTVLAAASSGAAAQQVLTYLSYGNNLSLSVPTAAATASCASVPLNAPVAPLALQKTFMDAFDTFDSKASRWTTYLDAAYDTTTKLWSGAGAVMNRTRIPLHEQQLYVDSTFLGLATLPLGYNPFILNSGYLSIVAQRLPDSLSTSLSGFGYTSGVLTTRRSQAQLYGYFEARLKVPANQGAYPAFTLTPWTGSAPPELAVMEAPTQLANTLQQTIRYRNASGGVLSSTCNTLYSNYSADYHQYGALWTAAKIVYYIDRVPVAQVLTPATMNVPMVMQVGMSIGGDRSAAVTASTPMPVEMVIDNVVSYSTGGAAACTIQPNGVNYCVSK